VSLQGVSVGLDIQRRSSFDLWRTMTSGDGDYITVLPDYAYNDVTSTDVISKQRHRENAVDEDDDDDDARAKSRDVTVTSLYEHPQPSAGCSEQQQQVTSTYQRVITSRRHDDVPPLVTSDMTYDEIADIPLPPPPRPGVIRNH